jgi:alpha-glucosidase
MKGLLIILLTVISLQMTIAQDFELYSPDKKLKVTIGLHDKITYSVWLDGKEILSPSPLSMTINGGMALGVKPRLKKQERKTVDEMLNPVVQTKSKEIRNNYNEIKLSFNGNYGLAFRAFNDGAAYRFETNLKDSIQVDSEEVNYNFAGDYAIYFPEEESFQSHNERIFKYEELKSINQNRFCSLPALVDTKTGVKIAVSESDLEDYAGLWLKGSGKNSLTGTFPGYPLQVEQTSDRDVKVSQFASFIAKTSGTRSFPWRLMAITRNDTELITNQLVYQLAKPSKLQDVSWIKPGKVAWDWWNFNNIYQVDFRAGVNTETYKYFIDFASKNGLEYVVLDEGWYKLGNLMELVPEINMEEIISYANQKKVGIILWVVWKTLDDQLQPALYQFQKWGVKGIKVDFMQRDDQWMVNYYYRIAKEAAKRKMLVDFHGAYKPCGLNREYPNVITSEGVKGLENNKWSLDITPEHDVTLPFTRMWAGPMDFTPGAMINATKADFRSIFNTPMSQGTRCHQLAMYAIFESPLQMLADNPTHYNKEPECLQFLSKIPSVWDATVPLQAKVGDYIAVARKKGAEWYVGAMTDWDARELIIDLSFLDANKNYTAEIYEDGINADRNANDYKKITKTITKSDKLTIKLAPGGGWAARIF